MSKTYIAISFILLITGNFFQKFSFKIFWLACISVVPWFYHCNCPYIMVDWIYAGAELLTAACEGFVVVSIYSSLSQTYWEEGEIRLTERNSSHGTPTGFPLRLGQTNGSLCARLSDFLSPLDTAFSVPCNPGPTVASSACYGTLWTASAPWPLQPNHNGFTARFCLRLILWKIEGCISILLQPELHSN